MYPLFGPLVFTLAAALASASPRAPAAHAPPPQAHHIDDVPFAEPHPDWCGPAALAAVLQYHGDRVTAADIAADIYLPGYRGALNLDLLLWARRRGYPAWAAAASAEMLRDALSRDRPVICMVRRRGPLADRNHFLVVRGYDDSRGLWFVDSGRRTEELLTSADLERDWRECGRWMLVVEGGDTPQTSGPADASR